MPPRVTVVVTQRERMSLTERSLESVLSDRSEPFELIYVAGGTRDDLRHYLEAKSAEAQFRLLQQTDWLWPNVARNLAMAHVTTEYVVFIDNDVLVEKGWLQRLVSAADETGAALVGPLYLWSDGEGQPRIHMAGGVLRFVEADGGLEIFEHHNRINESLTVRTELVRGACDYLEYHCMLVRTDFLRTIGGLDEKITCVHEHIDLALEARKRNLPVIMEPSSGVDYLAFVPLAVSDADFYQWRWSKEAVAASLNAFCEKWGSIMDGDSLKSVQQFAGKHREEASIFIAGRLNGTSGEILAATDVRQTSMELLKQAFVCGYGRENLFLIDKACSVAMALFGDGYRPCGRPFLLHMVGTSSVLIAFGFSPRVVVCGMLHAAYTHVPVGSLANDSLDAVQRMLRSKFGVRVEQIILEYARFQRDPAVWIGKRPLNQLTLDDATVMAIGMANELEEHAAGEFLFTTKRSSAETWLDYAAKVADVLKVPDLALSLSAASRAPAPDGFNVRRKTNRSFRLLQGNAIPMEHGKFGQWDTGEHRAIGGSADVFSLAG